jgi:hypothetical protein
MDIHPYINNDHPAPPATPSLVKQGYLGFPSLPPSQPREHLAPRPPDMRIVYPHPASSQPLSRASRPSARARALNGGAIPPSEPTHVPHV